ncbi:histidine kinase [Stenotrophomonas maltophilia]|nr:histidine kinase [Stenotrophomonas maltophilia]MBN5143358.1 histidine kinase [Stenotrophomonas maltophilia]QGL76575.1 histidine kinase [Stenotrophomonas maltophilia]CCP16985.1 signal transduction histidine kinase, LytS [Stenotrophomonas maltophilia RA8]
MVPVSRLNPCMPVSPALLLPAHEAPLPLPRPHWVMLALWGVLIATAVPAVHLSQQPGGLIPAALFILGAELPWMLATPLLWDACRRWPLSGRRHLAGWLALCLLLTPLLTALGWTLGHVLLQLWQGQPWPALQQVLRAIGITALFALPTFIAVAGVGHGLAGLQRLRAQSEVLQQARETALRQHLQHHFLFNALNAIGGLALQRPRAADAALAQLSSLLRDTLQCPSQRCFADELGAAQDYVALQSLLHDQEVHLHLQANADALAWTVPGLLLQPLIENAVLHSGWQPGDGPLRIELWAGVEDGLLDVVLFNPCLRPGTNDGLGTGQAALQRRLAMMGGRLQTASEGGGYRARVTLPECIA